MKKFTLLELLIVIAILGILMTLLLPSLSQAREKAKAAICLANYKQLVTLNYTFSKDNGNRSVGSGSYLCGSNGSVEYPQIFNWLYFERKNVVNRLGPVKQGELSCVSSDNIDKWNRATTYNIDLRGGFWWGADSPSRYGSKITDQTLWPGPAYHSGTPSYKLGAFLSKVNQPSDFLMFADADASNDFLHPGFDNEGAFSSSLGYAEDGTEKRGSIAFRHSGKTTAVYTDGSANFLTPKYENFKNSKVYLDSQ